MSTFIHRINEPGWQYPDSSSGSAGNSGGGGGSNIDSNNGRNISGNNGGSNSNASGNDKSYDALNPLSELKKSLSPLTNPMGYEKIAIDEENDEYDDKKLLSYNDTYNNANNIYNDSGSDNKNNNSNNKGNNYSSNNNNNCKRISLLTSYKNSVEKYDSNVSINTNIDKKLFTVLKCQNLTVSTPDGYRTLIGTFY